MLLQRAMPSQRGASSEGMRAMWKSMQERTMIKNSIRRSQVTPLSSGHIVWDTGSNSSSYDSSKSSKLSVDTPSFPLWPAEEISCEGEMTSQTPSNARSAQGLPTSSSVSGAPDLTPDWDHCQSSVPTHGAPCGMLVKNACPDIQDEPQDRQGEQVCSTRDQFELGDVAEEMGNVAEEKGGDSFDESNGFTPTATEAALELPISSSSCAVASVPSHTQAKKSRPRPPKPKRQQGKQLAEMYFQAQMESEEQRELAELRFLQATSTDQQLYDYAHSVLRCLNTEALDRENRGEDPSLTRVRM